MSLRTFLALLAGFMAGFAAAVSLQSAIDAGARSKAKRSAAEAASISLALEAYRSANGRYPKLGHTSTDLAVALVPGFLRATPSPDIDGQPFRILMDGDVVAVVSTGRNGIVVERGEVIAKGPAFPEIGVHLFRPLASR